MPEGYTFWIYFFYTFMASMSYRVGEPMVLIILMSRVLALGPSNNGLLIIISAIQHPRDHMSIEVV